ncbi:hypothetical protein PV11_08739 [Exophiala sideris]|uniref:Carboxylic ester hydrolase n=1 Tax=Exophiala sideris TaxID=1016849 RepID=A0A0D1VLN4_9EURO|nr:hypothetical protein PV11_08739 [Exophiala sideris]
MTCTLLFASCALTFYPLVSGASHDGANIISGPARCLALTSDLQFPNSSVVVVEYLQDQATLTLPGVAASCGVVPATINATADLCRVVLDINTTSTSSVIVEGWLPTTWNSRLVGTGGGGISGCIDYPTLMYTTDLGFASFGTNAGHNGSSGYELFINQPEVKNDYGWRGVHTQALAASYVVETYYGNNASKKYYVGCSTGGRQGITEALKFPDDFDGILAGSPGVNWYNIVAAYALNARKAGWPAINSSSYVTAAQWGAITQAQIDLYDGLDGVNDSIIDQPYMYQFDPNTLRCGGGVLNDSVCLTPTQIDGVQAVFQPITNSTGQLAMPGWGLGSSTAAWSTNVANGTAELPTIITDVFRGLIFDNASWSPDDFSLTDLDYAARVNPGEVETSETDLSDFHARGGKLLSYQGGYDNAAPFELNMWYYSRVGATLNMTVQELQSFYRLIYVNGMYHCTGGPGAWNIGQVGPLPSNLNSTNNSVLLSLVAWVETGQAPNSIVGSLLTDNGTVLDQRTHCVYPAISKWDQQGDTSLASSRQCVDTCASGLAC